MDFFLTHFGLQTTAQTRHVVEDHLAVITVLSVPGTEVKALPVSTRGTVVRDLSVETAKARTLVPGFRSTVCNTPSSNMAVRGGPVPSIEVLKDQISDSVK
ncbi:hypothetical protein TNCV_142651 [Trichonephila clavipes]|nr:hypothetical protein TNCV_142651 [Trichonephila clavipes]